MNHKLNFEDLSLVYFLSCKCCGKQYAGVKTDSFKYRRNKFEDNDRKHSQGELYGRTFL